MSAKEDLQRKIQGLQDQLSAATKSLNDILISEFELKPGDVVVHYRTRLTVSSIHVKYDKPRAWGRAILKDGSLGKIEHEIYGQYAKVCT